MAHAWDTLPKTALGLDAVDLDVAAVIVDSRSREDGNAGLHAISLRLHAAAMQLAPPDSPLKEEGS